MVGWIDLVARPHPILLIVNLDLFLKNRDFGEDFLAVRGRFVPFDCGTTRCLGFQLVRVGTGADADVPTTLHALHLGEVARLDSVVLFQPVHLLLSTCLHAEWLLKLDVRLRVL